VLLKFYIHPPSVPLTFRPGEDEILVSMEELKNSVLLESAEVGVFKGRTDLEQEGGMTEKARVTKGIYSLVGKKVLRIDRRGREALVGFASS